MLGASLVVAALLGLSACTPEKDVSVRLVDSEMVFTLCRPFTFNRISVMTAEKDARPSNLIYVWSAEGNSVSAGNGSVYVYGQPPDGMATTMAPSELVLDNHYIQFYADWVEEGDLIRNVPAQFDGNEISSDYWLNTLRGQRELPCG